MAQRFVPTSTSVPLPKTETVISGRGDIYNLKRIDLKHKNIESILGLEVITDIKERDEKYMSIGTANGLYLLEKATGKYRYITLPVESSYIYTPVSAPNGLLYIGTNNSGLLIYDPARQNFEHYHKDNCALICQQYLYNSVRRKR